MGKGGLCFLSFHIPGSHALLYCFSKFTYLYSILDPKKLARWRQTRAEVAAYETKRGVVNTICSRAAAELLPASAYVVTAAGCRAGAGAGIGAESFETGLELFD